MSKIALLGDLHIGIKQGDTFMEKYQNRFFNKCFFPYIKKNKITKVIQTGDWFDSRRAIRHSSIKLTRQLISKTKGQDWYVLVGNHDMGVREKIHPNACTEILAANNNFTIIDKPITHNICGLNIDMIPWICRENKTAVFDFIDSTDSLYCVGHFELSGFYYYKGIKSEGRSKKFLSKYNKVWSGHYHTASENDNIKYLGTPYQLTFGDANDIRGFWVFDTETKDLEFIENPYNLYTKIIFNHSTFDKNNIKEKYKDMFVRVLVEDRGPAAAFDMIMDSIAAVALDLDINDMFEAPDSNVKIDVTDTLQIINNYIDELDETTKIKNNVKTIMKNLYKDSANGY